MRKAPIIHILLVLFVTCTATSQWEKLQRFQGPPMAMGSLDDTLFISAAVSLTDTFRVYRSSDYGNSWSLAGQSSPAAEFSAIQSFTTIGNTLYAATGQNGIYKSTDGGFTWSSINAPAYLAITYSLGSRGDTLFAGYYGVAWSTNGGTTWTKPTIGPPASITTSILSVGTTLFVASEGVSRSTDGGLNWSGVNNGLPSFDTYYLASLGSVVFVNIPGYGVYRTTNYGTSWEPSLVGDSVSYATNVISAAPYLIASTDYGVYVSRDTGRTWRSTGYADLVQFQQLHVAGPFVYAGDLGRYPLGNLFPTATSTQLITSAGSTSFNDGSNVTGVTLNLTSVIGAANVTVSRFNDPPVNPDFAGPSPAYVSQYRWVISAEGAIGVTGEIRISLSAFETGVNPADVHIYKRNSSGIGDFVEIPTTYVSESNEVVGTITGFSEFVFGSNAGPLDVGDQQRPFPQSFGLMQNYPNPFNPSTAIEYTISERSRVLISVLNILGQEIAVLRDDVQSPGSYIIRWDGTARDGVGVPSGVYLCHMTAGGRTSAIKLLLLR